MKTALAVVTLVAVGVTGIGAIVMSGDSPSHRTDPDCVALDATSPDVSPGGSLAEQQIGNARAIAKASHDLGLGGRATLIALTVAVGESDLINLDHGDTAGPDSRGIFQQRDSWGSLAQRMDPYQAAIGFFRGPARDGRGGLTGVPGWQQLSITNAGHQVQRNADPNHYISFENRAKAIAAKAGIDLDEAATGNTGDSNGPGTPDGYARCQRSGGTNPAPPVLGTGDCPLDQAGGTSCNAAIAWAMSQINAPSGTWHNWCLKFVSEAYGRPFGSYMSAFEAATALQRAGKMYLTDVDSIPRGAILWWDGTAVGNPAGHVAVYVGNRMILTTDATPGQVGILSWEAVAMWHQRFLGYTAPTSANAA